MITYWKKYYSVLIQIMDAFSKLKAKYYVFFLNFRHSDTSTGWKHAWSWWEKGYNNMIRFDSFSRKIINSSLIIMSFSKCVSTFSEKYRIIIKRKWQNSILIGGKLAQVRMRITHLRLKTTKSTSHRLLC